MDITSSLPPVPPPATASSLPSAPVRPGAGGRAIAALVLGILGLTACVLLAPFAWYLGHAELKDIRLRGAQAGGQGVATIGMVLGIVGTSLMAMGLAFVLFLVMAAVLVLGALAL